MNNLERLNNNDMDMKKAYIYIIGVALLTACSGDINYEMPDNAEEIQFTLKTQAVTSRAVYNAWSSADDPASMGVFGYANDDSTPVTIFNNVQLTHSASGWGYASESDKKFWGPYVGYPSTDFFGYMPYNASATLTGSGNTRTLSIPVTLVNPIVDAATARKAGLLCSLPEHRTYPGAIPFKMDQTLTGFNVWFKLGDEMAKLRDFEVTDVSVIVPNTYPKTGTAKRQYTFSGETWLPGSITWEAEATADPDNFKYTIPWTVGKKLLVDNTEFKIWGTDNYTKDADGVVSTEGAFFAIPSTSAAPFNPTLEVTYNVKVKGEGDEWITRLGVVQDIQLKSEYFSGYNAGTPGRVHPIQIKIVPSYLYVLADKDQASGYITIE